MTEQADAPHAGSNAGVVGHLRSFLAAALGYLRARLQLVALESKEATKHYVILAILLVLAVFAVIFGYLFLCVAGVFLCAMLTGWNWPWFMLALALLHLGGAFVALLVARERASDPMFRATLNEFRKDRQWLSSQTTPAEKQN